ncbi:MAG: AAA family ATPase [Candidatus Gracilibacteria bacterium]|jgi:hypothetical protein
MGNPENPTPATRQRKNPLFSGRGEFHDWEGPTTRAPTMLAIDAVKPSSTGKQAPFRLTSSYAPHVAKPEGFVIDTEPQLEAVPEISMDDPSAEELTPIMQPREVPVVDEIQKIDAQQEAQKRQRRRQFLTLLKGSVARQETPRQGSCIYVQLDLNTLIEGQQADALINLLEELDAIKTKEGKITSEYAVHVDEESGDLIIIALSERASNSALALATSITSKIPRAKAFVGMGKVVHEMIIESPDKETGRQERKEARVLHSRISDKQKQDAMRSPGAIFLTQELADRINTRGSREGSLCEIKTEESKVKGLVSLTEHNAKVSYDTGAEKVIGADEKIEKLLSALLSPTTRLTIVKGHAGIGKTTIINAVLEKTPGSTIRCSFDPSFSGKECTPHGSLVTMLEQVAAVAKEHPQIAEEMETNAPLRELIELSKKPRSEKMAAAQKDPDRVATLCSNAIAIIRRKTPHLEALLVLEDLHHIDSASDPYVMSIAQAYMDNGGKVLFSMRPEEMLKSVALKKLTQTVQAFHTGRQAVAELEIDGLDFSDPKISEEFAFSLIPEETRKGKKLGTWHEALGKKAGRNPLRMKALMAKARENLRIDEDTGIINVDNSALEEINAIESDQDFETYSRGRIAKLPPRDQKFLQALALIGGQLSKAAIQEIIFGYTQVGYAGDPAQALAHLIQGEYLRADAQTISFAHHTIRETVLASMDEQTKFNLAMYLNTIFQTNPAEYHPDARFALLQHVATNPLQPDREERFWQEYASAATVSIDSAEQKSLLRRGFMVADSVSQSATIFESIDTLKKGDKKVPEHLRKLVIKTLFTLAKTGQHLNKREIAEKALADLEEMHQHFPEEIDIVELRATAFQMEYLKCYYSTPAESKEKLRTLYTQLLPDLIGTNPALAFILEMKLLYKTGKSAQAAAAGRTPVKRQAIESLNTEFARTHDSAISPEFAETERLAARVDIENFRTKFKNPTTADGKTMHVDDDVEFSPTHLTQDQKTEAQALLEESQRITEYRKTNPSIFNPTADTMADLAVAGMLGYLGKYDEAIEMFGETWRRANQMDVADAVRAGQRKGDLYLMRAYTKKEGEVDLEDIEHAIQTYLKECMISLSTTDKNDWWQFGVRIQIRRSIARLLLEVRPDKNKASLSKEEMQHLKGYIEQALNDFRTINQNPTFRGFATMEGGEEYVYYASSYMGYIFAIAQNMGMDISEFSDEEKYPFLRQDILRKAYELSATFTDNGLLNEVETKRRGLSMMLDQE